MHIRMVQESVGGRRSLHHMVLIAVLFVVFQDLSSRGGAQAWTYNYSVSTNRGWLQARQWCQQHFTDMVSIRSKEENDYLNNMLPFHSKYYWIGIRKEGGKWIWAQSNKTIPQEAQNWAHNEPDNTLAQDCVEMYIKRVVDSGKWNNENCRKKKGTVCYTASCKHDSCSEHADCVETVGNFTCKCHPGFTGSSCQEDVDECEEIADPCGKHAECYNTEGSFYCQCQRGYMNIRGNISFTVLNGLCQDINECNNPNACGPGAYCNNTIGAYTCICLPGYTNSSGRCVDVDECEEIADPCGNHAECYNTAGSFYCQCQRGYMNIRGNINFTVLNGLCQDINECNNPNACGPGAYCNNTVGAYTCICLPGYTNSSGRCVGLMLRFIIVSVGLAALILAVVTVCIWTRIKGNKTQIDPDTVQDNEDFGSVIFENSGGHEASVRIQRSRTK
ncbi:L-selectin-like [Cheilinus undulatus]|uniref:L-selectin-like n=1 Tax=Cheilinus undulatus TaxID=241271 RepID=UPI001BD48C98|nr:L-selectin-like [Cheilinus undulatus]